MTDLIEITEKEFGVFLDLRYATPNNVCAEPLYTKPKCFLQKQAAEKLEKAILIAGIVGYKIKIFDGYRPLPVQKFMYESFPVPEGEEGFVSNPKTGAIPHCRGIAIDLTLTDMDGDEIDMGSDFDEFSNLAFHDCASVSEEVKQNRITLLDIMTEAGFDSYSKEWWHYQLFKPREYEICDNHQNLSHIKI